MENQEGFSVVVVVVLNDTTDLLEGNKNIFTSSPVNLCKISNGDCAEYTDLKGLFRHQFSHSILIYSQGFLHIRAHDPKDP